jgi:uncharacterized protein with PQ loop repeat
MDLNTLATTLAYVGSAIGVAVSIPQIQRIVANPRVAGVSPWMWAIVAVSCSLWMNYGVRTGTWPQVPGNTLIIAGAVTIVVLVPAKMGRARRAGLLALVIALANLVAVTLMAPGSVGFLAFAVGLFAAWPQVFQTVWVRRGLGPSAVSLTSNALAIGAQVLWLAFALITTDVPVIAASILAIGTAGVVLGVEATRRRAAGVSTAAERVLISAAAAPAAAA